VSTDVEALLGLAPLAVGTRVRIRLGGECPGPHVAFEEGAVGRIVDDPQHCFTPMPEHTVWVELVFNPRLVAIWPFARAELERL
jgi:hypothetical protein